MSTAARAKITMNLCPEHQLPKIDFKHHTRKLQDSLIDMSDALYLEIFGSTLRPGYLNRYCEWHDHLIGLNFAFIGSPYRDRNNIMEMRR